jgi:hypothetical protein
MSRAKSGMEHFAPRSVAEHSAFMIGNLVCAIDALMVAAEYMASTGDDSKLPAAFAQARSALSQVVTAQPNASAALLDTLTDHIATLEYAGFGGEGDIRGADAVDAVNDHFEALRDALATVRK